MHVYTVKRLYPAPQHDVRLEGLYLQRHANGEADSRIPHVYTSFITSLDGRIAVHNPVTGGHGVPSTITNSQDWRLYQELAARADTLLVSGRYIRELANGTAQTTLPLSNDSAFYDIHTWRQQQRLVAQPAVVIVSASLDLPLNDLCGMLSNRQVYVATGESAGADAVKSIEQMGFNLIYTGKGKSVNGLLLIQRLQALGFKTIYSIAGPGVFETLLRARVVDRIYVTQVHRLIGGVPYDTLLEGKLIKPAADFTLRTLYCDDNSDLGCSQFFGMYELTEKK